MSKLNIILDLDQTLLSAEVFEEYNIEKNKENKRKREKEIKWKNSEGV